METDPQWPRRNGGQRNLNVWMLALSVALAGMVGAMIYMFAFAFPNRVLYPEAGSYVVPVTADGPISLVSVEPPDGSLKLNISGAKIIDLIWDLDVGAAGVTHGLLVTADKGVYIEIETMIVTADCTTFTINDSEFGTGDISGVINDGKSFLYQIGTGDTIIVSSTRGFSEIVKKTDESYDKAHLLGGSGGALIKTFRLTVRSNKPCEINRVLVGHFIMRNSHIGEGDGLANKDFIIGSDVMVKRDLITGNSEVETNIR